MEFPPGCANRTMNDPPGAGIVRTIPFEAADLDTALGLVSNGLGACEQPSDPADYAGSCPVSEDMPNHCSAPNAWYRSTSVNPSFAARRIARSLAV